MPSWSKKSVCNWLTIMENHDFQSWKVMEKSWKMKFPGLWQPCHIVLGIRDTTTQTALLKERNLTLQTCIDTCKAAENAFA